MFSTARFSFRKVQVFHFAKIISGFDVTVITQKKKLTMKKKDRFKTEKHFCGLKTARLKAAFCHNLNNIEVIKMVQKFDRAFIYYLLRHKASNSDFELTKRRLSISVRHSTFAR